jgi:hypothetical protein
VSIGKLERVGESSGAERVVQVVRSQRRRKSQRRNHGGQKEGCEAVS